MKYILFCLVCTLVFACKQQEAATPAGKIERIHPTLDTILDTTASIEIIAENCEWSEGPLWIESEKMLLFSDVPRDTVFSWTEAKGKQPYLTPSGYTGSAKRGGEMGSNGLILDPDNRLVLCQHGNRQMARMNAPLNAPAPDFVTLADNFEGKKFNSPNDAVYNSRGELFFTDPPYGLEKGEEDTSKQIPFQGVYKLSADKKVTLLAKFITRPNGIGVMPGEQFLIVANSDGDSPYWYLVDASLPDSLQQKKIFYDASEAAKNEKGSPDGLKVDSKGNVYATGPGGIWIFDKNATVLGKIKLEHAASNCALSADEKTLFITNDMNVLKVQMRK